MQVERRIGKDAEHLLDDSRQNCLRGIGRQPKGRRLLVDDGLAEAFRNYQQRAALAFVDPVPPFLQFDCFGLNQGVGAACLGQRVQEEATQKTVVLVDNKDMGLRCGPTRPTDGERDPHPDEQRDRNPEQEGHRIPECPEQILVRIVSNVPDPHSLNSLPVSLMNRLSRLGWVRVVSRISAPMAESTCSRFPSLPEAFTVASRRPVSSA